MSRRRSPKKRSRSRRRPASSRRPSPGASLALFTGCVGLAAIGVGLVHEESAPVVEAVPDAVWNGGRVRVDVQNGGGVTGMARAATERLRPAGFDVVRFGNAPAFDPDRPSVVIDRVGRTDQARAVARALGIDNVLSEPNPNLYVDVTVVVGRSWDPEAAARSNEADAARGWWDPRGWFDG